jgi:hypothetical protein
VIDRGAERGMLFAYCEDCHTLYIEVLGKELICPCALKSDYSPEGMAEYEARHKQWVADVFQAARDNTFPPPSPQQRTVGSRRTCPVQYAKTVRKP